MMNLDDMVSVLAFLNRTQLLRFMQANRYTYNVIMKHFDKKPYIYAHISLEKWYVDTSRRFRRPILMATKMMKTNSSFEQINIYHEISILAKRSEDEIPEFLVHLTALNCDCEQRLSMNAIKNVLRTYKTVLEPDKCKCRDCSSSKSDASCSNILEKYELDAHKNCVEWTKVTYPLDSDEEVDGEESDEEMSDIESHEIHPYRFASAPMELVTLEHSAHREGASLWMHPMHEEDEDGIKYIRDEFMFKHRKQTYKEKRPCAGLELRSTDISTIISHLEADYVEIYKLCFAPYEDLTSDEMFEFTEHEFEEYYKMLCWLVKNKKITTNTVVTVDLNFMSILFARLQIEPEQQNFLLNSIGKCGHLEINGEHCRDKLSTIYPDVQFSLVKMCQQNEFLKNALLIKNITKISSKEILQLLKSYKHSTADEKLYRLFVDPYNEGTCEFLLEDFLLSKLPCSYFALLEGNFKRGKYQPIYYNQITRECLRIMPAFAYNFETRDYSHFYMARYDSKNLEAEAIFEYFFDLLKSNDIRHDERRRLKNDNDDESLPADEPPPKHIYSFSFFFAKFFGAGNFAGGNAELFNANFNNSMNGQILPP